MQFSERYGYKPVREIIQIDSIDSALKNGIWSLLKINYWDHVQYEIVGYKPFYNLNYILNKPIKLLCEKIWFDYLTRIIHKLFLHARNALFHIVFPHPLISSPMNGRGRHYIRPD